ncbi:MAG: RsmF rRNA methyltransferase first C-terminal domain-containing protein [Clostridia bacterium]|nr:RsmF rRNA methyltransferase first C-terminal domain-containing protein [Clostridia bacterium]
MFAFPMKFAERMKNMLGSEYPAFETEFESYKTYTGIRINPLKKGARDAVLNITGELEKVLWCGDGFYADKNVLSGEHPYHLAGLFYFQEPSAMSVVEVLNIQPNDKVLDLCAAPGGKSTQAGAKLGSGGFLVSNEIVSKRALILAENMERFGIANAFVTNETPERLEKRFPLFFDKIIVDAPCSGEGMFRKEPQAVLHWSEEHTYSCADRQILILNSAARMLKAGGFLVYSTCTFAPCENEGVIDRFLDSHDDFDIVPIRKLPMLADGCGGWAGSTRDFSGTKRIFPHKCKGEGHFIALLQKRGEALAAKVHEPLSRCPSDVISLYREFERTVLNINLDGEFELFGENLYLKPFGLGDIDKIKIVRCGLHLGVCKKGRFEPSHALCLALKKADFKRSVDFHCDSMEIEAYLRGQTLPSDLSGWICVCTDGYPLGWGKASGGVMKNHFPKYLRIKG